MRRGFRGWHERGYLPHYDAPDVTQIAKLMLVDSFPVERRADWERDRLKPALDRASERKPSFSTISDMPIERLYGPWYTFVNTGHPDDPDAMIAEAARIAKAEIAENRDGSDWIVDSSRATRGA